MKVLCIYLSVFTLSFFCSCKKIIEDTQRNAIISIITTGQWHIESFVEGTTITTAQFEGYNFQFTEDGALFGNKGTLVVPGTWTGDISNYSITSNFPSANDPIKKLNGTWKITDSATDYVAAEMRTLQGLIILHLRKNP